MDDLKVKEQEIHLNPDETVKAQEVDQSFDMPHTLTSSSNTYPTLTLSFQTGIFDAPQVYRLIPTSGQCLYSSFSPEQASPRHPMREWSHSLIVSRCLLNAISFGSLSMITVSKISTTHAHVLLFCILLSCFTFF